MALQLPPYGHVTLGSRYVNKQTEKNAGLVMERKTVPYWLALLFLMLGAISWAGSTVAGRAASGNVPPFSLSFIRWFFVVLCFLLISWRQTY